LTSCATVVRCHAAPSVGWWWDGVWQGSTNKACKDDEMAVRVWGRVASSVGSKEGVCHALPRGDVGAAPNKGKMVWGEGGKVVSNRAEGGKRAHRALASCVADFLQTESMLVSHTNTW